jgi:hypothetical protein
LAFNQPACDRDFSHSDIGLGGAWPMSAQFCARRALNLAQGRRICGIGKRRLENRFNIVYLLRYRGQYPRILWIGERND